MDHIVSNADIRDESAKQRLGSPRPQCTICGESHPDCLELHHIAGRAYDGQVARVCSNCHRKLSNQQRDQPAQIAMPPSYGETIGHYLIGLADLLRLVAERLIEFGLGLIERARQPVAGGAQ